MNTVKVALEKVNLNVSISNLSKFPVLDILEIYWNDDNKNGWNEFLSKNNFEIKTDNIRNLEDVVTFSNYCFNFLKDINTKNNIGKLDFRLASVLKQRFLTDFKKEEFQTLCLDISSFENDEAKKVIKEAFNEIKTNAFIDFKEIVDDKLYYTYNRKGLLFDGNKFSIATARERVNLTEDYKFAKDNNFIGARLILELSKIMVQKGLSEALFSTTIVTPTGSYDKSYNAKEVVRLSLVTQEEKEELKEAELIKKAAAQEIKDANNLTRGSLNPDSNMSQINKTQPELRINNSFAIKINYGDGNFFEEIFKKYEQIQLEILNKKLKDVKENGHKAYSTLKTHINNGLPIFEAINTIKQEFRDEEVVRFASFLLTKDLLDLSKVENEVESLKISIAELNVQNDNLSLESAKKETTIKELQGTVAKKNNELNILKETYTNEMEMIRKDAESKIQTIQDDFKKKINEANHIIDEQEKIISKLQFYEKSHKNLEERLSQLEEKNQTLEKEKISLQEKLLYSEKEFKLKEDYSNEKIKELKIEIQNKESQINQFLNGKKQDSKSNKTEPEEENFMRVADILDEKKSSKR